MSVTLSADKISFMFTVDEPTAEAIRRAVDDGGELAGVVELRRHFPLLADNAHARRCVQMIAGWQPRAGQAQSTGEQETPDRTPTKRRHRGPKARIPPTG